MLTENENCVTSLNQTVAWKVKIIEATNNEDVLSYIIKTEQLLENHTFQVNRQYEDFEWLQHCLMTEEGIVGLQGIIFPPLPLKLAVSMGSTESKTKKQLGARYQSLMEGDWQKYCRALEDYLNLVISHTILSKLPAVNSFLTQNEPLTKTKRKKGIFDKLSHAMEELRKENHKDTDDFFQNEREINLAITAYSKTAAEKFLEMVSAEQRLAIACGHLSTALHFGVSKEDDPVAKAITRMHLKLSEVVETMKKNFECVGNNNINTLGFHLEMYSRYHDAFKEMLFRRTCKLIEVENTNKSLEKAKPPKKSVLEEVKKQVEEEFNGISQRAKKEIQQYHKNHTQALQRTLVSLCETQLKTAQDTFKVIKMHLSEFGHLDLDNVM